MFVADASRWNSITDVSASMPKSNEQDQVVTLAEVTGAGLVLDLGYQYQHVTWFEVEDIAVGTMSGSGGGMLFTLAIGLASGRTIIVREGQPAWRSLIEALPLGLPEVIPFTAWSAALVSAPSAPICIYARAPMGTA